jgi:hypothetical protein
MDQAQGLSRREKFKRTLEKFWRAHIIDDDPYDAFENEQFEALIRGKQGVEKDASAIEEFPLAA